jgi:hypothetical protein
LFLVKTRTWLVVLACCLGLSIAAVAVHFLPDIPGAVRAFCEAFASPGELLWWTTLGGAFAGYPSGVTGGVIWVLGTALFWFIVAAIAVAIVKALVRSPAG